MLRIRIDGGQLSNDQLRTIADISERYARGTADLTDRQNVQLHWIRIEDVPAIWEALEAVGLSTMEACGDTPRVVLGCQLAGIDADEVLDATPQIEETTARYVGDATFSNWPQVQVGDERVHRAVHRAPDQRRGLRRRGRPRRPAGLRPVGGGGLSTNPMIAKRLGAFIQPTRSPTCGPG